MDLCVPVQRAGREQGFLVASIALSPLLEAALPAPEARRHEFSFVEGAGTRLARGGGARRRRRTRGRGGTPPTPTGTYNPGGSNQNPDGTPIGQVSSGAYGYSVGKSLAIGYVKAAHHVPGLEVQVAILGQPHTARLLAEPPFDPTGQRLRG